MYKKASSSSSSIRNNRSCLHMALCLVLGLVSLPVFATVSTSTSYQLSGQFTPVGGQSTSASFQLQLSAEPELGYASSASFQSTGADLLIVDDQDGVDASTEDTAHNDGDGNGDGAADSLQPSVASVPNAGAPGTTVTLHTTGADCSQITGMVSNPEGTYGDDPTYEYPVGLVDFSIDCLGVNATTSVTIYYDQVYDTSNWVFRKYTGTTFVDATAPVTALPINIVVGAHTYTTGPETGNQVTTITYQLQDGDNLDEDNIANASIVDPFGPAILVTPGSGGGGGGNTTPDIITLVPDDVTDSAAELNGTVRRSDDWNVFFVISSTDSTPSCSFDDRLVVTGTYDKNENFTLSVDNLDPETTYYYRACGEDTDGDIESGLVKSFTTGSDDGVDDASEGVVVDPQSCSTYLTDYIRLGRANDSIQVTRLQKFLNEYEEHSLVVDGIYNQDDYTAVLEYQQKYSDAILAPWNITEATGYVFKTTSSHINSRVCLSVGGEVVEKEEVSAGIIESSIDQLGNLVRLVLLALTFGSDVSDEASPAADDLGAFDAAPFSCPLYLTKRTRLGQVNDSFEVLKIQKFLNVYRGEDLALDATYDQDDFDAVVRFQQAHHTDVLAPWGFKYGTGDVYVSTTKHINAIVCGGVGNGVDEEQYGYLFEKRTIFNNLTGGIKSLLGF